MRRKLINLIAILTLALPLLAPTAVVMAATPTDCPSANTSGNQILQGIGKGQPISGGGGVTVNNCDSSGVTKVIKTVTIILSYVVGALAIIMIVLSGFKYITSGGDATKVTNAKSTLLYALIGVAIAAVAQLLVHFVLRQSNSLGL